jgi:hypothetical protein
MQFALTTMEKVSPKSHLATCVNLFAARHALYTFILPSVYIYFENPFIGNKFSITGKMVSILQALFFFAWNLTLIRCHFSNMKHWTQ